MHNLSERIAKVQEASEFIRNGCTRQPKIISTCEKCGETFKSDNNRLKPPKDLQRNIQHRARKEDLRQLQPDHQ